MTHTAVENARAALAAGRCIVIIDEHRDLPAAVLAVAAQHITPAQMTLFVRNSSGTIGVAADGQVLDRLGITAVTAINQHPRGFNMSVPVDVAGLAGGSSAAERVATAHALADPTTTRESFIRPGYTTCFRAQSGGVLRRAGATEAAVDLARLAGCEPVAVMSEAMDDNGELLAPEHAQAFAAANDMVLVRIEDVIEYRMEHEPAVELVAEAQQKLHDALLAGDMPQEIAAQALSLLIRPDKQSIVYKALDAAAYALQRTPARLLLERGALSSVYQLHYARFLHQCFPGGTGFDGASADIAAVLSAAQSVPLETASVSAVSIDDATTTEIDDAFSVTELPEGGWRVGIHIAAPGLVITPESAIGMAARERASTVYFPGEKIN